MFSTSEEVIRAYDEMRSTIRRYSDKIQKLNDGETECWIEDSALNLFSSGLAAEAYFEDGKVTICSAGAQIRISLEKEKIVCDGKESHNKIISWMSCDKEHLYELEQDTKPKKQVIL